MFLYVREVYLQAIENDHITTVSSTGEGDQYRAPAQTELKQP